MALLAVCRRCGDLPVVAPRAGGVVGHHVSVPGGGPPLEWPLHSGLWRSLVSASVWGTEGPEFKSRQPDKQCAGQTVFSESTPWPVIALGA